MDYLVSFQESELWDQPLWCPNPKGSPASDTSRAHRTGDQGGVWRLKTGLSSGAPPSPVQPGSPSHGSQAEQRAGGAGPVAGPLRWEWSRWWRQLVVLSPWLLVSCMQGSHGVRWRPGWCHGDRMGPQTDHIPTPQLPDCGSRLLAAP